MSQSFAAKIDALKASGSEALTTIRPLYCPGTAANGGVFAGVGAFESLGTRAAAFGGGADVLVISDDVLQGLGMVDMAAETLRKAGLGVTLFTDVRPEPVLQNVTDAEAIGRAAGSRIVVGLGGGSAMDVAKAVAVGLGGSITAKDYVTDPDSRANASRAPLILVPTTAGTGSEVSLFAVISEGSHKRLMMDPLLLPDVAILDPLLTVSMPQAVTAATGIDALTHAIEGMTHKAATPMNDALSLAAIAMIGRALPTASAEPENLQARADLLVGSAFAMMSFNMSGALWAHSVSYIIGMEKPTPHGIGCALGLPYLMAFNERSVVDKHSEIVRVLGHASAENLRCASPAAASVLGLMKALDMPLTLADWGVPEDRIEAMAEDMQRLYPRPGNPRTMDQSEALAYWRSMYIGELV